MKIYEWVKIIYHVAKEKISVFYRGFLGGSLISGTLLFNSGIHNTPLLIYAYFIKIIAVLIAGLISGFATILGNDIYHWVKAKVISKQVKRQQKRKTKKAA